ncbi:hypothetical protein M427DRAFT_464410 [Gonapodya prolifera JEL478]|uniref:RING-type E3 ubiquitin transferase n=1 Tax=Gonapodya prolifera (strain JEL478) TaxID=1344416 RepID=A0A139A204_GONPJ|nr:hypothetical protein M427DRAFT_464410 [Gonapodya prolifera JEL478]|eukprot:KXS10719.1 hypothetical protein M427DRAFT_464410 [Gonapodya prolifera JEL478]
MSSGRVWTNEHPYRPKGVEIDALGHLSAYELVRDPVAFPEEGDQRVTLPMSKLEKIFQCPICLDVMNVCVATTACLHRFCKACLSNHLFRAKEKVCPTCRKPCPSMRSTRKDERFQGIIKAVFPG